jgi:cell shape-determining protein MreC
MGGERMSDKLQQIRNILASHFGLTDENEDGTYLYHLTRSKEAFSYGTMTLDDFVEVDEEFLDEVFEDIKPVIEELQQENEQNAKMREFYKNKWLEDRYQLEKQLQQVQEENEKLRKQLSMLCPIADLPTIESLLAEKEIYMEKIKELEQENKYYKEQLDISRNMAADIIVGLQKELMEYKNKLNNIISSN